MMFLCKFEVNLVPRFTGRGVGWLLGTGSDPRRISGRFLGFMVTDLKNERNGFLAYNPGSQNT
jgi:hypothetical protein